MILVLDTETTGLPKNYRAPLTDFQNWPRAVQIAWALFDDRGEFIRKENYIIYPYGFEIPNEAVAKHGIDTLRAQVEGELVSAVLFLLSKDMSKASLVVAHNLEFDAAILGSEFLRLGPSNPFTTANTLCTMRASTDFCAIPGPRGNKWPKLSELYAILFDGAAIEGEHNAMVDALACAKCYFELFSRGVILDVVPSKQGAEIPAHNAAHAIDTYDPFLMPGYTADQKLAMLASERAAQAETKATLADLLEGLKKSDVWAYYENASRLHAGNIERLEAEIKADFVKAFDGQNKKPHQYVTLKSFDVTKIVYDPEKAFRFCLTNLTTALSLDQKEFDKQARTGKLPTELVTVLPASELRAQISTDLSAYLVAEKEAALDAVDRECPYCRGTDLDMDGDTGGGCTHCINGRVPL